MTDNDVRRSAIRTGQRRLFGGALAAFGLGGTGLAWVTRPLAPWPAAGWALVAAGALGLGVTAAALVRLRRTYGAAIAAADAEAGRALSAERDLTAGLLALAAAIAVSGGGWSAGAAGGVAAALALATTALVAAGLARAAPAVRALGAAPADAPRSPAARFGPAVVVLFAAGWVVLLGGPRPAGPGGSGSPVLGALFAIASLAALAVVLVVATRPGR